MFSSIDSIFEIEDRSQRLLAFERATHVALRVALRSGSVSVGHSFDFRSHPPKPRDPETPIIHFRLNAEIRRHICIGTSLDPTRPARLNE
jgi:hypothetical protein